jgi:hypothetical protein
MIMQRAQDQRPESDLPDPIAHLAEADRFATEGGREREFRLMPAGGAAPPAAHGSARDRSAPQPVGKGRVAGT